MPAKHLEGGSIPFTDSMMKRKQGDIGVYTAILHYGRLGVVSLPLTEGVRYDLVFDDAVELYRIQVKTCRRRSASGYYEAALRTNGANYSTRGNVKKLDMYEFDKLFIVDGDGLAWEFDSNEVHGMSTITLNDNRLSYIVGKYSAWE